MNGEQQRMLQCRDELHHLIRKCCSIGEESECNTNGDCAECAEPTAAIKVDRCRADAKREGDTELVEVPPRSASNNECTCDEREPECGGADIRQRCTNITNTAASLGITNATTSDRFSERATDVDASDHRCARCSWVRSAERAIV